jgi:hypothetical protein
MGKTVASYRMVLEDEIYRWKSFRDALAGEDDKAGFDDLMDMCRNNAMAAGNATNPIVFEPMAMSMLLGQRKKIQEPEYKLSDLLWQRSGEVNRYG